MIRLEIKILQCDINRYEYEYKYEYLTDKVMLPSDRRTAIEQTKFNYSP